MNNNNVWDSIQFVIVLYKESLQETKTFKSLEIATLEYSKKLDLFVYDNSPSPKDQDLTHKRFNIEYVSDTRNSGLSKAYNTGFKYAEKKQKEFTILLDQDTEFTSDFYNKYSQAITSNPLIEIFAPKLILNNGRIFSPSIYKFKRGWHPSSVNYGINKLSELVPVNSGVVISTKLFKKVGGYNENLRIDFIDFEFMERVKKNTNVFYLVDTIGNQDFSDNSNDMSSVLHRYNIYLKDITVLIKENNGNSILFYTNIIFKTIKLSFRFKTFKFSHILYKELFTLN